MINAPARKDNEVGWWLAANAATAQLALHLITAEHEPFDGGPARYGFPLPAEWAGPNSMEVVLCPLAWIVDLLSYTLMLAPLFILGAWLLAKHGRVVAVAMLGFSLLTTSIAEGFFVATGDTRVAWRIPIEHTRRSLHLGPGRPRGW